MQKFDLLTANISALRREKRRCQASAKHNIEMSLQYARAAKKDEVRAGHISSRLEELKTEARDAER